MGLRLAWPPTPSPPPARLVASAKALYRNGALLIIIAAFLFSISALCVKELNLRGQVRVTRVCACVCADVPTMAQLDGSSSHSTAHTSTHSPTRTLQVPVLQVLATVACICLLASSVVMRVHGHALLPPKDRGMQALAVSRGVLGGGALVLFYFSMERLALKDAVTLFFTCVRRALSPYSPFPVHPARLRAVHAPARTCVATAETACRPPVGRPFGALCSNACSCRATRPRSRACSRACSP
jgi:hypothetical protein